MITAVAQLERERVGERRKAALQAEPAPGERAGTVHYGFELDPTDPKGQRLRPCKREQTAIRAALKVRQQGMTLITIADALTKRHQKAVGGEQFHAPGVWKTLRAHATT